MAAKKPAPKPPAKAPATPRRDSVIVRAPAPAPAPPPRITIVPAPPPPKVYADDRRTQLPAPPPPSIFPALGLKPLVTTPPPAIARPAMDASRDGYTVTPAPPATNWSQPSPPAPPVQPYIPPPPPPPPVSPGNQSVKIARSDVFINGENITDPETMADRLLTDIGGMELLELTRVGAVDGIDQSYLPITGLADINMQNDPLKIIQLQNANNDYFLQFSIQIGKYTPYVGTGPDGDIVYIDRDAASSTYNSLIINTVNLKKTERLEIEFISFDKLLNDTIIET